jgi:7-cyano-7-deazaguanine synthase
MRPFTFLHNAFMVVLNASNPSSIPMCGILATLATNVNLSPFIAANSIRGRDSWGFWTYGQRRREIKSFDEARVGKLKAHYAALAALRAEPTTEWVRNKRIEDVQPFETRNWVVVHNGTIANDKELRKEFNLASPTRIDSWVIAGILDEIDDFNLAVRKLVGSYAICAIRKDRPDLIFFAMNYRPLYLHNERTLSSVALSENDRMLPPYSIGTLSRQLGLKYRSLYPFVKKEKALVVCSGGLDSTVAAAALLHAGMDIELLHFNYGCRATMQEATAIRNIATKLNVPYQIVTTPIFTDIIKGSPLTNTERNVPFAEGEAGAEYAHEWVPARNLIMLSIATGIAESKGFNVLALGANMEEAGAYPDNEPAFYDRFEQLLPFAVGDGIRLRIVTPVGNLMKHEIVKLGIEINAPLEFTWSCYNNSTQHCGYCGPCFMRRTAFEMNQTKDPVFECAM